jgi:glyceraldehyde-3-phosphate dehydrogenase/erythrose-4-phosphate dehydrogenase
MRRINVAIAGLGRVGSQFLDALLSVSTDAVKVIAVAEPREELESVKKAKERGIAYYKRCQRHAKVPRGCHRCSL